MVESSETERQWRTLVVAAVTLAYPVGQTGFELGAYGELLFSHKLVAWIAVTATFIAFVILPKQFLPVPRWHIWVLAVPSLWMFGRFATGTFGANAVVGPILFAIGIGSFVLCFPYAVYLLVRMANPDLTAIRGLRAWSLLLAIGGLFFVLGYLIGSWSQYFVSCQEARIGRIELPDHCQN